MPDPINVSIGGEVVSVPPILNFAGLERAWPAIKASAGATDPIARVSSDIAVISAAIIMTRPDLTVPVIKERLRIGLADDTDERSGVSEAVGKLLVASGLIRAGEATPPEGTDLPAAELEVTT